MSGLGAALLASAALAAQPVALKPAPTDDDGTITLGDLFEGAGEASSSVVGPGPKAGGSVVLEAARVQAAARAAGLAWANPSGLRRISVRGAAWSASSAPVLAAASPARAAQAGSAEVLTYARSLNAGAVVTAEDLTWSVAPRAPIDPPQDAEDAIGLAVRKPVRAGAPVSGRDLVVARAIAKNDTVSVHYKAGPVSLMMQGKALTSAALGETVRILNPQSKSVIEAVAAGPGVAVVGPQAAALKSSSPTLALR